MTNHNYKLNHYEIRRRDYIDGVEFTLWQADGRFNTYTYKVERVEGKYKYVEDWGQMSPDEADARFVEWVA